MPKIGLSGQRARAQSIRTYSAAFVFDATGERLTPTYAVKKGTRCRYYISASLMREARSNRSGGWRIPAGDLEGLVINRLRTFLTDPTAILDVVDDESHGGSPQSQLVEHGRQTADELEVQAPDKVKATLMALLCRVAINSDGIVINISRRRLAELLSGQLIDLNDTMTS